jgi:hypothetical protein
MSLAGLAVSVCVALALPAVAAASAPRSGDPDGLSTTVRAYYAPASEQWCVSHGAEGTHAETGAHELGSGNVEISEILVELSGLDPSSEYCTELVAENADGTAYGGQVRFTTPTPPAIESESVLHVTTTDATLEATINPLGRETTYVFYLEAPSCREDGPGACEVSGGRPIYEGKIPAGTSGVTVSVNLGKVGHTLSSGTFYGYRVTATNTTDGVEATSYGQLKTFITDGPRVSRLEPDSGPVSGGTRITIFGNILENTRSGSVYFGSVKGRIIEEECDGMCEIMPYTMLVVESPPHEVGTVNVTVENEQGYVSAINPGDQFTYVSSPGAPPSEVVTGSTEATPSGYKLKGKLNPGGLPTTYYYEYIGSNEIECLDIEPGLERCWHETAHVGPITGDTQQEVPPIEVTGLTVGVTYHYRLVASNADRTVFGNEASFTVTAKGAPSEVVTEPAEATPNGFRLKGKLNPDGLPTTYYYEYASDTCDEGCTPMKTAVVGPLTGDTQEEVLAVEVTDLTAGQYWYRLVASNADGTEGAAVLTFKVPPESPAPGGQTKQEPTSEPPLFPGPPLIAVSPLVKTVPRTGPLTRAQKLADALKACEHKPKKRRAACEKQARKTYSAAVSTGRRQSVIVR